MNTNIQLASQAILFIFLISIPPLFSDPQVESPFERIEILNSGRAIKTISAKLLVRKDLQWIAIRVKRRDFTILPRYSHLHIGLFDESGKLLKTDYRKLSEFEFQHSATGRHRDKVILHKTDFKPAIVKGVSIKSYEEKHDHQ